MLRTFSRMLRRDHAADLLRDTTRSRVTAAGSRFVFRDAIGPFTGHAVCSSTAWLNGLSSPIAESFHPDRPGHSAGHAPLVRGVMG